MPQSVALRSVQQRARQRVPTVLIGVLLLSMSPTDDGLATGSACAPRQAVPASDSANSPSTDSERTLEPGKGIGRELSAGQTHNYTFTIEADYCARLIADQQGIDVVIRVFDGEDRLVVVADRPNGMRGPEAVSIIAGHAGVYHVVVTPAEKAPPPGRYEIVLKELRRATADDSRRILAERSVFDGEVLRGEGSAGAVQQAIRKFEQSAREWATLGERYEEAVAFYGLAWSYYVQGEFQKAARHFDAALATMTDLDDAYARAINIVGLAFAHINLGDNEGALSYFLQALDLHRRVKSKRGEAIALYGIGWVQALLGHDDRALAAFLNLLPLRRAIGDRRGEARTLSSIGDMYRRLGNYQEALSNLSGSLQILRELNDHYAEANTLSSIGWTYSSLTQYERALANFNDALNLRREVGDRAGEATTLYGIARTMDTQGDPLGARERMETALDIIESLRAGGTDQELRTDYFALVQDYYEFYVDLLMRLHSRDQTAGYDARALQASERAKCRTLLDLLKEAQEGIRQGVDPDLLERTRAVRQDLNSATARYRELLTRNGLGLSPAKVETLTNQHREVERLTRQYEELESRILAASPKYADQTQPHILSAEELRRQLDGDTLLLEYTLGKERSYMWAVTSSTIRSYELPARSRIETATQQVSRLVAARTERHPGETTLQRRARVKRADVEYWRAAGSLSAMLLGPLASQPVPMRLVIVPQGSLQSVSFGALPMPTATSNMNRAGTARLRRPATDGPNTEEVRPLILNHEVVILPSASTLAFLRRDWPDRKAPAKTVAILADPVFSADDERVKTRAKGPNTHTAENLNSASGHDLARQPGRVPGGEVATGGHVGIGRIQHAPDNQSHRALPRLFATRSEASEIMSLVRADDGLAAIDFRANRALATSGELSNYRIVHFATHALIDNEHPDLSAIALSAVNERGEEQDGFLRAREIFNLKLTADLVVLSACRTGTGKEVAGEGLLGLTRPFMYAGAPRVIVSLWPLDDRATAELMARFYKQLLGSGRLSPAAALRSAQVEMWRESRWRSPYFWGAFMLQGEWR